MFNRKNEREINRQEYTFKNSDITILLVSHPLRPSDFVFCVEQRRCPIALDYTLYLAHCWLTATAIPNFVPNQPQKVCCASKSIHRSDKCTFFTTTFEHFLLWCLLWGVNGGSNWGRIWPGIHWSCRFFSSPLIGRPMRGWKC